MGSIAFLGPAGTFTETALDQLIAAGLVPSGCSDPRPIAVGSTRAALTAVRDGGAVYACVPIENSIEGGVGPTLDGLASGPALQIFAETTLDVSFAVVVRRGQPAGKVRNVAAHPVAGAQVREWLAVNLPGARLVPADSNVTAALQTAAGVVDAAVTTSRAAATPGLSVLADGVIDEPVARTRFVLVGPPATPPARTGDDRSSVALRMDNVPGALLGVLTEFGERGIDLTRIESRPTRTALGTYVFFLDCSGHRDDAAVRDALQALSARCTEVRYLGSWPVSRTVGGAG